MARRGRGGQGQGPGRRDGDRQRERGLIRRRRAYPSLPAAGRREGLPGRQVRGPAQAGDRRHVRRQRGDPGGNRRRRRPVGRPASRPAVPRLPHPPRPTASSRPGPVSRRLVSRRRAGRHPVSRGSSRRRPLSRQQAPRYQGPTRRPATHTVRDRATPPRRLARRGRRRDPARVEARPRSVARSAPAVTGRRCRRPDRMTRILTRMTRTCPLRRSTSSPAWPSYSAN